MSDHDFKLNDVFRELAQGGPQSAPASVERALVAAFRKRRSARRLRTGAVISGIAAIAAGVFAIWILRLPETPAPRLQLARIGPPAITQPVVRAKAAVSSPRRAKRPARGSEIATAFYPLPGSDMLAPLDFGSVVRVELPRSALAFVGLPVNQNRAFERVQADVLLGQDGLARAVRFIQ